MEIELLNIDCKEYMKTCKDKSFDLAIVDPPYGLDKSSLNGSGKLKHRALNRMNTDWDIAPDAEYFKELFRVSKNQIVWGGNYFPLPPSRGFMIWDKKQFMPTFSRCEYAWISMYVPSKIFAFDNSSKTKIHPTQKPVELYEYLLHNYAKEGARILDTHMGSGSIAIACHYRGYNLTACEIDKHYYDAACKRFKAETSQLEMNFGIEPGAFKSNFCIRQNEVEKDTYPITFNSVLCDEKSFICEKEYCNNDIVCNDKKQCMWKQV